MKRLVAMMMCAVSLGAAAQSTITYPYNPDGNADALIGVTDLQDMLSVYGGAFSPSEIMVGDTALSEWIQILYQTLQDQQAVIEAMQEAEGNGAELGGDLWYQSWHPSTSTDTVADQRNQVYYHGFFAPHSGTFTEVKVRARNATLSPFPGTNAQIVISAGLYLSNGSLINPEPSFRIAEGSVLKVLGTSLVDDQIIDIQLNSPVEVVKGDIYFVAISWTPADELNRISLYGTNVGIAPQSSFFWQEGVNFTNLLPLISNANEDVDGAFWFVINGPE